MFNKIKQVIAAFKEASTAALVGTDEMDENKYRRLSGKTRDLTPMKQAAARSQAIYLWQRNPLARRLIEIILDFCLGTDFQIRLEVAKDDEVANKNAQDVWDKFANDPLNDFYSRLYLIVLEQYLTGELLLPVTKNPVNGRVLLGYIDSALIDSVKVDATGFQTESVVVHDMIEVTKTRTINVIRYDTDPKSATFEKLIGDAFFFQNNKLLNQSRGYSYLTEIADWLDFLDQFLFNSLEHSAFANAWFYDCKMIGATDEQLKKKKDEMVPPKPGSVKLHNEKVEWNVITPNLNASDTSTQARLFKNFILAAKGFPEHWFAEGGETNRSTAQEMGTPTFRMLKNMQNQMRAIVKPIVQYVMQSSPDFKLTKDQKLEININMFDFERNDASKLGLGFGQLITALAVARDSNWLTDEKAKEVVDGLLSRFGSESDLSVSVEEIAQANALTQAKGIYKPGLTPPAITKPGNGKTVPAMDNNLFPNV